MEDLDHERPEALTLVENTKVNRELVGGVVRVGFPVVREENDLSEEKVVVWENVDLERGVKTLQKMQLNLDLELYSLF